MGHVNFHTLHEMVKQDALDSVVLNFSPASTFCEACVQGKAHRKVFPKKSEQTYSKYGEKIITDLWGPAQVLSLGGHAYTHMFEDLLSCEPKVLFLKAKSEAIYTYKEYESWLKAHCNPNSIACLGSDWGGEFTSEEFNTYLKNAGTIRHLNVHDSPQSNSVIERLNQRIFVEYDKQSKGYRIFYSKRRTMIIERDVYFDKDAAVELENP